jgi:Bacterial lectin
LGKRRAFRRITDEASLLLAGNPRHGSLEKASLPICGSVSLYEFHTHRTSGLKIRDWFQLTDGGTGEVRTAWTTTKLPLSAFTNDFTSQLKNAFADGFTFTIQNAHKAVWAFGDSGGGLGSQDIQNSVVSVVFDIYNDAGKGTDSTGVYTAGAAPTTPSVDRPQVD